MKKYRHYRNYNDFLYNQLKNENFSVYLLQLCYIDNFYPGVFYSMMRKAIEAQGLPKIESREVYYRKLEAFKESKMDWLEMEQLKQDNQRDHDELDRWED